MAVGLLRPDGGTVRIFGREILLYLGLLRGMARDVVTERADELLRVLELDGAEGTAVVDYSTGMKKKITLATALLHNPRLLLAGGGSVIFSSLLLPGDTPL
jgi:ABC-2 type transport system ATP-binding protein